MDTVFQEESAALARAEKKIQDAISQLQLSEKEQTNALLQFHCMDRSDLEDRADMRARLDRTQQEVAAYKAVVPSPYFGRMDMECSGEPEPMSIYIGKAAVSIRHDYIVFDWRSPLGQCFYMKSEKQFHVNDYQYQLLLRRALEIKDAKLVTCETEYDADAVSLEGEVVDPFLLTVLRDKRRQNRLTDIIKTIQETQNEIIRKPLDENFVLQGCAGSGKTMILLHRLSYIKFNHKNMSFDGTKIITPNKYFDAHINDLSEELGLHEITRLSIEEYYAYLLKKYDKKSTFQPSSHSEVALSNELLKQIYSAGFAEKAAEHYHAYWKEMLAQIHGTSFEESMKKYGIAVPDESVHRGETVVAFQAALDSLSRQFTATDDTALQLKQRIANIDKQCEELKTGYEKKEQEWQKRKEHAKRIALEELEKAEKEREKCSAATGDLNARTQKAANEIAQITDLIRKAEAQFAVLQKQKMLYTDLEQVAKIENPLAKEILEANASNLRTIQKAQDDLKRVAFYSFGKKNDLKQLIARAAEVFSATAEKIVDGHLQEDQKKLEDAKQYREYLRQTSQTLQAELSEENTAQRAAERRIAQAQLAIAAFSGEDAAAESPLLDGIDRNVLDGKLAGILEARAEYASPEKKLRDLTQTKGELQAELALLQEKVLSTEQKSDVAHCRVILDRLSISGVVRDVLQKDLKELFEQNGVAYPRDWYRFHLYLYLLYFCLYFGRAAGADSFVCIDEAQDLSVTEYQLLRNVLGERCVFNLYGDVNQQIYRYKGIDDWDELSGIIGSNLYFLNENYRNAQQITDFCNREFDADVRPIGITGREVQETDLENAVRWLIQAKKEKPQIRAAVICKTGNKSVQQKLHECLLNEHVSWNAVDDEKISVADVEQVKGLEFDAVVAIVGEMSVNEKYVAFTRALDALAVVRDGFGSEQKKEDPEASTPGSALTAREEPVNIEVLQASSVDFSPLEELQSMLCGLKAAGLPSIEELSARTPTDMAADRPEPAAQSSETVQPEATIPPKEAQSSSAEMKRIQAELRARKIADFGEWLLQVKKLAPRTAASYTGAISFCDEFAKRHHVYKGSLADFDTVAEAREAILRLLGVPQMFKENRRGRNIYSAALNKYLGYLDAVGTPPDRAALEQRQTTPAAAVKQLIAPPAEQDDASAFAAEPEPAATAEPESAATAEPEPRPAAEPAPAAEHETELARTLAEEKYKPLLEALACDGITTLEDFRSTNVLLYINRCAAYTLQERIRIWDEIKPVWKRSAATGAAPASCTPAAAPPIRYTQLSMLAGEESKPDAETPPAETPSAETLPAPRLAKLEEYVKGKELEGCRINEAAEALSLKSAAVMDVFGRAPYVEIRPHVFIHESVIVDLKEAGETLEAILQKQFLRFYGYTTSKKLFEAARIDLSMFMNDNGFSTEEEIYALAEYLFAKKCSDGIRHCFFGNLHIWQAEPDYPKSTFGVLQNLARNKEIVLKREDIEGYMSLVGLATPSYKQALQISVKSTFLQYEAESVILTERIPAAADGFAAVGRALDALFASAQVEYVILRDIHAEWYAHQLPLLPGGLAWTPLLLQEVIKYFLAEKYITVKQSDGMALDTVQAAIVPVGGPLVTWGDIVYAYWMQDPERKTAYTCEEFRQYLCAAKMLQGSELRNSLPRALDDARFSWDTARENVRIVGG